MKDASSKTVARITAIDAAPFETRWDGIVEQGTLDPETAHGRLAPPLAAETP